MQKIFGLSLLMVLSSPAARAQNKPARACDEFIAQYCASSPDHGPHCLAGLDNLAEKVSPACLADVQTRGHRPHRGGPPRGEQSPGETAGQPAGDVPAAESSR